MKKKENENLSKMYNKLVVAPLKSKYYCDKYFQYLQND